MLKNRVFVVAAVIAAVLMTTAGVARADLIGYWKFNETSGTTAYDSSGSGNHGTLGGTTYLPTQGIAGEIGTAYQFVQTKTSTGANCYVSLNGIAGYGQRANYSLSSWFYLPTALQPTSGTPQDVIFQNWEGAYGSSYILCAFNPKASTRSIAYGAAAGGTNANYNVTLSKDVWHQVTATYDALGAGGVSGQERLYYDGQLVATVDYTVPTPYVDAQRLTLGLDYTVGTGAAVMRGYLDDMGYWDQTLLPEYVSAIYETPVTAGLKYGLGDMKDLFVLYEPKNPNTSKTITDPDANGGLPLTWHYSTTGFTQIAGKAWFDGTYYYVQLGASDGVTTAPIPEPSMLALLATALIGLLAYAWRKRK